MKTQPLPTAEPADAGLCPDRVRYLVQTLQADVDRGRLPGAVVLLARHGRVVLNTGVGTLDPARDVPMTPDAIFRIYSMTKPIVSVATMMLVEQGRLLLDDPVHKHLPAFADQQVAQRIDGQIQLVPVTRPATVQDLLRHTAGLTYEFLGVSHVQRLYAEADIGARHRTNAQFCDLLASLPLYRQPGSVWAYSRATDVLGRLIEVITGQPLGQYLQDAILRPLGMLDTGFQVPPSQHGRIAEPFDHDPDGGVPMRLIDPREQPALEMGGGGLMATVGDYARFLQCLLNGGALDGVRLLGPRTVEFMTSDHLGTIACAPGDPLLPPGHGFGLGFAVRTAPGLAHVTGSVGTYHWSGIGGTSFFVDPTEDFFGIFMAQAPNQREHYRGLFRNMAMGALVD